MNQRVLTATILASILAGLPASADVVHRQLNARNTLVEVSDDNWQPDEFPAGTAVPASYIADAGITIDGRDDEAAWSQTAAVEVPMSFGAIQGAELKALYTDDEVFIRVRWADDEPNRQHRPWHWDADGKAYREGSEIEDSVLLSFEAGCEWAPSFLAGYVFDFDGWHWLAARSDPLGQALDLYGNVQDQNRPNLNFTPYRSRNQQDIWNMKFVENRDPDLHAGWDELDRVYMMQPFVENVFFRGVPDGYKPPAYVEAVAPPDGEPADPSATFPQFRPVPLDGQAGEVAARGTWQDGFWTVEFRRARITEAGTLNDTEFKRLTQFSVHIFDGTDRIDESAESGRLFLQFLAPPPALVEQ